MKYYSEKLDKMFDSQSELFKAERESGIHANEKKRKNLELAKEKYEQNKKEVNKILEKADEKAKELYKQICEIYDTANEEAVKLHDKGIKEYRKAKEKYSESSDYTLNDLLRILGI